MKILHGAHRLRSESGQGLVEFTISAFVLVMLMIGVVEVGRLVLVYTTISNAARAGARYAIVHGANSPATASQVQSTVTGYLAAAPMTTGNATVTVTGAGGAIGSTVTVTVTYPYDPFSAYFPLSVNLGSTSQGVITF